MTAPWLAWSNATIMARSPNAAPPDAGDAVVPRWRRALAFGALMLAGEAIFGLPFHVARFFRPTLLAALGLTNTQLGALMTAYGVLALLCYFPGGLLADRYPARRLMCAALVLTAAGGVCMATLPGFAGLLAVFAAFGVTTILLFWAALIRAVRAWGGATAQGRAFGALDAGREQPAAERALALRAVIGVYIAATLLVAALVWLCVPARDDAPTGARVRRQDLLALARSPALWLHALVVVSAYCAYKSLDNLGLFAVAGYGLDEVEAARVGVVGSWIRPLAALAVGLLADALSPTRATRLCFAALALTYAWMAVHPPDPRLHAELWAGVALLCAAAYGLRGAYFAIFEELRISPTQSGAAIGLVSVIGFTPDVFLGPLVGWLLDHSPGPDGHRHAFALFAATSLAGLAAAAALARARRAPDPTP